ncbi:hypothetical protein N8D74_17825 (plasmid) [Curtobacterium flaccumfaciens]|uniref:Uncharacterized protein n=1 Tax=Curtobacterium poinsettiae TaxID=159612 RepID=A0A9Q9PAF4_9MICO|nr:hypothetical protein [Curtobacterium flaccumfaciens]MBT1620585.1 hypothetical protein [Curtobacterium flaccumfaciens pv. poinsettiae]MCS6563615.1 hypothetical protein [Curtobacterium flaccumfaciens pv. poinsettiae]MCU0154553.1 hypothetical protein [Curtobacterium flaccumfaciens pv. poinsettiae]UXN16910.1 hypothetical protein N8D76_17600 [Curtobacterium flaccumfaciens pv. poinsettiae]UXN27141.1 hypothetical protein N8D74_17825 [Curtobacterium flaccumfaciens]
MNGTPTPADELRDLAAGPAITPKVVYGTIGHSTARTIPMPVQGHALVDALGGVILPISPSTMERVNLLDPVELFGTPPAGVSPNHFIFGAPGAGHMTPSKETR